MGMFNIFDMQAKLGMDKSGFDRGLADAETSAEKFAYGLGKTIRGAAMAIGAGITAAAGAVANVAKQAVESYAEYEQLVGGVETLFKDAADSVKQDAAEAFEFAGISANEYMQTVTSFSASLMQSLGNDTAKAAQYSKLALQDMSDNANKMGSDMASIQRAYQGFAKQNYMMLDNLKLGYGGTKTEMERLILDAEKLDSTFRATRDDNGELAMSYADIIDAIHIVQTEMGITGTTALEASTTIQGSIKSFKSAWANLITGIADNNADFNKLVDNLASTAQTAARNLVPRIGAALSGIGKVVTGLAPIVKDALPGLVNELLPPLVSAGTMLFEALASNIGIVVTVIEENLPAIVEAATNIFLNIVQTIADNLPLLMETIMTAVANIATTISDQLPVLMPAIVSGVVFAANTLIEHLPELIAAVITIVQGLADGIIAALPIIIEALPKIISGVVGFILSAIPQLIQAGIQLFTSLVGALPEIIKGILTAIPEIISGITDALVDNIPLLVQAGFDLFVALIENLPEIIVEIVKAIPDIITSIVNGISEGISQMVRVGAALIEGLWNGIKDKAGWLWDKVKGWCGQLWGKIKDFFGIRSPSRLFREEFGKNLMLGFAGGIDKYGKYGVDAVEDWSDDINKAVNIDDIEIGSKHEDPVGSRHAGWQLTQNIYAEKMTPSQAFQAALDAQETAAFLGFAPAYQEA